MKRLVLVLLIVSYANAQFIIPGDVIGKAINGERMSDGEKLHFQPNTAAETENNNIGRMGSPGEDISPIESQLKEQTEQTSLLVSRGNNSFISSTTGSSTDGETSRTLLEESATLRYLAAMQASRALTGISLSFISPALAVALENAEASAQRAVTSGQVGQLRHKPNLTQAEVGIIQCADAYIKKKQEEAKTSPTVFVPPFQAALEFCESLAQKGQLNVSGAVLELGANAHLAAYPAHPIFIMARHNNAVNLKKFFGESRLQEPNILYLWEILTLRKRVQLEVVGAVIGFFSGGTNIKSVDDAHKELDFLKNWMDLYAGDVRYTFQNSLFSQNSHFHNQSKHITPKIRYLELMKAAYRDLMGATHILCNYQNRVDGATNTYVPFSAFSQSDMNQNVTTVNPNDMWERLKKAGLATPLRNRLKNLSAGPFYAVDVALPSAIQQLFVTHENPIVEGPASGGTGGEFTPRQVQVDCSKLSDDDGDKISTYLEMIEKGGTEGGIKVFSPRVRFSMLFAHNIALAQMAHEAVTVFKKLEGIYGYPKEDEKLIENGEWMAIRDLRESLGKAAGFNGDQFKGRPFEVTYAERVKQLNELTVALANDLDRVRGTGGSTLAGVGAVSAGGGIPFK